MQKLKNIPLIKIVICLLLINLLTITAVFLLQNKLPPEIPLFYGRAYGEKQLVPALGLVLPSIITIIIITINALVSTQLEEKLLHQILITTSIVATILSLITTIKIVLLVGNI